MSEGDRSRLSLSQRTDIWSRWKSGQSLHEIGRAFGKPHSCIRCLLLPRGGIGPAARCRSRLALTLAEREDISRGIASGSSFREIARHLDRAASTVSREVTRHGGLPVYRAHEADEHAWDSALRPKQCLLALHPRLREMVASKLILDWSREEISGWLKTEYPDDGGMHVSHENHLPQPVHPSAGSIEKRADGPPAVEAAHAPLAPCNGQRAVTESDRRCHIDPRKACGSGRSSDSWSLGRRPAERRQEQLHCDPGRTSFALCHADQGAEQRNGSCGCCLESACS
jgi:DNA-binding CsgD family transcriptional regulator